MNSIKKTFVISLSTIVAFVLILTVWISVRENSKEVYSSLEEIPHLEAKADVNSSRKLTDWEKEILERKTEQTLTRINYTEDLSRSVLEEYFKYKNSNTSIDENQIAQNIISGNPLNNQEVEFKEYSISDLKIVPKNDALDLKTYANKLGEASVKNVYQSNYGSEFEIFTKAMQLGSESEFKKLDPFVENYNNLVSDLLKVEVPSSLTTIHIGIINSISGLSANLDEMSSYTTDPFRGLFVLTAYAKHATNLQNYMKDLNSIMKEHDVSFNENDYGYSIERAATVSLPQ